MKIVQKLSTLSLLITATIFSGCEAVDSALEIKANMESQVTEITNNINQIQKNIEQKKAELDKTLQELEDARNSLSQLFNSDSPEAQAQEAVIQKEIKTLEQKTKEIKNDVLQDTQTIDILENTKKNEQESTSGGVFSIE